MDAVVKLINEVGFPIAAAIGLGLFIWKLINKIIDGNLAEIIEALQLAENMNKLKEIEEIGA